MSRDAMTDGMHEQCTVTVHRTSEEDFVLRRARAEYREAPGLRLTIDEAMQLWDLDRQKCEVLLTSLVDAGFLVVDAHGKYRKAHCGS